LELCTDTPRCTGQDRVP